MKCFTFLCSIGLLFSTLFASPAWITKQIAADLEPYIQSPPCERCMKSHFEKHVDPLCLVLFRIRNNRIHYQTCDKILKTSISERFWHICRGLQAVALKYSLPDTDFLVTLHDCSSFVPLPLPLFVMAKPIGSTHILFPDFEALAGRWRVIQRIDPAIVTYPPSWEKKINKLIWRGAAAQGPVTKENMHEKSRVTLCKLSKQFPDLIDAGLTGCNPNFLAKYCKPRIPYEEIFKYKYQFWVDGNTASYSESGWRLYSGCTILKPDSDKIQWYYGDLQPGIHYIPVKADLSDLVDTILLLRDNDEYAHQVAMNALQFAREHLNKEMNLLYLHDLLWAYSKLPKVERCTKCEKHV